MSQILDFNENSILDWADELYVSSQKYHLDNKNLRCSVCNCVSSHDISDPLDDNYTKATMMYDPRDSNRIICSECYDIVFESLVEFDYEEEKNES